MPIEYPSAPQKHPFPPTDGPARRPHHRVPQARSLDGHSFLILFKSTGSEEILVSLLSHWLNPSGTKKDSVDETTFVVEKYIFAQKKEKTQITKDRVQSDLECHVYSTN